MQKNTPKIHWARGLVSKYFFNAVSHKGIRLRRAASAWCRSPSPRIGIARLSLFLAIQEHHCPLPQLNMVDNSSRNAEVVVYLRVLVFFEVFISKLHDFRVASLCPASSACVSERCITTSILAPEIVMAEFAGNLRSRLSHHAQFPWRALSLRQVVPVDVLHHHRGLVVLTRHPSILASSFHPPHHGKILASTALNR